MKFHVEQPSQDATSSFQLLTDDGETLLRSGAFDDRESALGAIRASLELLIDEESFTTRGEGDGVVVVLADDGDEIARSAVLNAAGAADLVASIISRAAEQTEYEVTLTTTTLNQVEVGAGQSKVYVGMAELYDFSRLSTSGKAGFELFQSKSDEKYALHFNDDDGRAILYSRGFASAAARARRIHAIAENAQDERRIERREQDGRHLFILKSRNGREIARSGLFSAAAEMEAAIAFLSQRVAELAAPHLEGVAPRAATVDIQYDLDRASTSGAAGFELFRDPDNKQYYFHFNDDDGKALLYSEGYASKRGRDNGVRAVIRNSTLRERWREKEEDGETYLALVAGNNEEIARTRSRASGAAFAGLIAFFMERIPTYAVRFGVELETVASTETDRLTLSVDRDAAAPERDADEASDATAMTAAFATAAGGDDGSAGGEAASGGTGGRWWIWLLLLLLLLVILIFLLRGCGGREQGVDSVEVGATAEDTGAARDLGEAPGVEDSDLASAAGADAPPTSDDTSGAAAADAASATTSAGGLAEESAGSAGGSTTPPSASASEDSVAGATTGSAASDSTPTTSSTGTTGTTRDSTPGTEDGDNGTSSAAALGFASGSMEARMADYLIDAASEVPETFVMEKVGFPHNSAKMNAEAYPQIDNLAKLLAAHPSARIEIRGHIDGSESDVYRGPHGDGEITLSAVRARCLYKKLLARGIAAERMSFVGFATERPVAGDDTEDGRRQNRRLEVVVVER